ncbi:hypothetical protein ABH908_000149 [Pseudomonas frederiksbergensis]|uniref:hypothetical protein n=1 Tax=Pseudomonas TaxID=286 RepID=UPI003D20B9E0
MTQSQRQALETLQAAFRVANENGSLDVLNDFQNSPDSINDVVDALEEALTET